MKKEMLINVLQPEECRIAILEDGVLEELYVERTSHESYVGNIYKGRIVNIEPSIQAAFVDFGVGRNGFLHVSDVEPAYYRHLEQRRSEGGRGGERDRDRGGQRGAGRRGRRPGPRPTEDEFEPSPRHHRESTSSREDRAAREVEEALAAAEAAEEAEDAERADAGLGAEAAEGAQAGAIEEAPPEAESQAPAEAEPAAEAEAEPGKARRRPPRGRSRRARTEEGAEPAAEAQENPPSTGEAETKAAAEATKEPEQTEAPRKETKDAEPPEKPRLMGSTERRTDEHGVSPRPLASAPDFTDDDLSFSRAPTPRPADPAERPQSTHREPEPRPEPEPVAAARDRDQDEDRGPRREHRRERPRDEVQDRGEEPKQEEAPEQDQGRDDLDEDFEDEMPDDRLEAFDEEEDEETPEPRRGGGGRGRDDRRGRRMGGRRMGGRPGFGQPKPLIQDIFKRGQEVLVQVIKEGIGTKGPTLSTYISIAGRYLVLMPGLNRIGVSRKIVDEDQRRRLREILSELEPPKGLGFIIRTAGLDRTKKELQRDLAYLSRLWQVVVRRIRKLKAPAEIYQESDMITRTIRDTFTSEIDTIWVDEPTPFEHAQEFLTIVMPRYANRIKLYSELEPMFHKYGIEEEIARIQRRHVPLPNGGSIVIDQTEALVAIDVNSGNFRADNNAEETAYQMNLLAAREIARQLRLRDLGGVIVNDFIDMRDEKHRRGVEKAMRDAMKRDRARAKILKISQFGIIEMTRQRIRPSLKRSVYQECSYCHMTGQVKTVESMSIDVMRMLQLVAHRANVQRIQIKVQEDVANYLHNRKRKEVSGMEEAGGIQVSVVGVPGVSPEFLEFLYYDSNNNEMRFVPYEETKPRRR